MCSCAEFKKIAKLYAMVLPQNMNLSPERLMATLLLKLYGSSDGIWLSALRRLYFLQL